MRTEKQIAASRVNGAKSQGPRYSNPGDTKPLALKNSHRALADVVVHPNESRKAFLKLCIYLDSQFAPETAVEDLIVGRIAVAHWRQLRYWRRELEAARQLAAQLPAQLPDQLPDQQPAQPESVPATVDAELTANTQPEPHPTQSEPAWEPAKNQQPDNRQMPVDHPTNPAARTRSPLDPATEHRLDTAFFRAITIFYRVREFRTSVKSTAKSAKLLKQITKLKLVYPDKTREMHRENPTNPEHPTSQALHLPPDLLAECLETTPSLPTETPDPATPNHRLHILNTSPFLEERTSLPKMKATPKDPQ